jgi:hypothetical protein
MLTHFIRLSLAPRIASHTFNPPHSFPSIAIDYPDTLEYRNARARGEFYRKWYEVKASGLTRVNRHSLTGGL